METKFARPIGDKVIIKQHEGQDKVGILYVPETSKEKPASGTIMAVGTGTKEYPVMYTKVGDKVSYNTHAQSKVAIDGQEYIVLPERELYLIF